MAEQGRNRLTGTDRALLRAELEELVVENAYLLDRGRFTELLELYTDDCEMFRPLPPFTEQKEERIRGRAALAAWYAGPGWPKTPRTMRHVVSNLRLGDVSERRVTATVALIGYRYEGAGISAAQPMMVGDYEDEYRCGDDGRWRIHRRRVVIAFLNRELVEVASANAGRG
jgi:3-phenylpropionate/cinnamic acid dioxygenase small subunit